LLACCVLVVGGVAWFAADRTASQDDYAIYSSLQVGDPAPDFTLDLLTGEQVTLSEYRGQPVFVNFWATWCHFCVEEMPLIQDRYEEYASEMAFLVIDQGEFRGTVADFVEQAGYPFPILLDPAYQVGDKYLVDGYPMSFFIDSEGIIRYIANGMMEDSDMNDGLRAIGVGE